MTESEFNAKYKAYIPDGWGGLEFDIPRVTDYLDTLMEDSLTLIPGFQIHQIKLKFGMCRFYFETSMKNKHVELMIELGVEEKVNEIIDRKGEVYS